MKSALNEKNNIVITEKTAIKYFGKENPLGKILTLSGHWAEGNFTITGVLKELPLNSHLKFDFLLPMKFLLEHRTYNNSDGWTYGNFVTYITIQEAVSLKTVSKKYDEVISRFKPNIPLDTEIKIGFQALTDIHLRSNFEGDPAVDNGDIRDIYAFSIIAVFLLIIAWVNYINLSTARSMLRAKEVGIRKSIGAFRKQLISQFMMESFLFNFFSAVLAIGIAYLALPMLNGLLGKELEMDVLRIPIFWIWFLIVIILGSFLSGLYPALILSAFKPAGMLNSFKISRVGGFKLRRGLIVFQFLISLLLMSGTYLVYSQITFMKNRDVGMDMEKVMVIIGPRANIDWENLESNFQTFKTMVASHHSISTVSNSGRVPGKGFNWRDGSIRKIGAPEDEGHLGNMIFVDADFTKIYDYEFLAGRSFTKDMLTDSRNAIINEEAAHTYGLGPPENAINEKLIIWKDTVRVIGVLKNFHWHSLRGAHEPYLFRYNGRRVDYFSLKVNLSNTKETISHVESTYNSIFPDNPFNYFFLDDEFNRQYRSDLQFGNLFSALTVLAIFIACIGLFALVSFTATLRIREIGIRKVLGASIGNLMLLLSREYFTLLLIAIVCAIPVILFGGNSWLDNYAFRTALGLDLFIIPALVLILISILTVSYRTYSTAKSNPVESLRAE